MNDGKTVQRLKLFLRYKTEEILDSRAVQGLLIGVVSLGVVLLVGMHVPEHILDLAYCTMVVATCVLGTVLGICIIFGLTMLLYDWIHSNWERVKREIP